MSKRALLVGTWVCFVFLTFLPAAHADLPGDFPPADNDVDGSDLAALIANPVLIGITIFAQNFGKTPGLGPLGFGTISGETGYVLAERLTSAPSFHANQIDFGSGYDAAQLSLLAQQAEQILGDTPGGSSAYSVAFSYEILNRAESAVLLKAGSDIVYSDPSGKKQIIWLVSEGPSSGLWLREPFYILPAHLTHYPTHRIYLRGSWRTYSLAPQMSAREMRG